MLVLNLPKTKGSCAGDMWSLGVVLFEMLSGGRGLASSEALGWAASEAINASAAFVDHLQGYSPDACFVIRATL